MLFGIYDGIRFWQDLLSLLLGNIMMVRYDHCHPQLFGPAHLLHRRDPVITGQNGIHPVFISRFNNMFVDPISVFHPVRDLIIRHGSDAAKGLKKYVGGTHPVDIVIPHDPYPFSLGRLFLQNLRGPVCILQQMGRIKILLCSIQIPADRLTPLHIPVPHNPCRHRVNVKFSGDPVKIRLFRI